MATTKATPAKRVRRTKAQIAADNAAEEARREQLAQERAAKIPTPKAPKFSKLYHVVSEGGFTALGNVWYRGQEILIEEGTEEFELAFDRKGNYVFDLDENQQIEAFGEVQFREGPWPGLPYDTQHIYEPGQVGEDGRVVSHDKNEVAILEKINRQRRLNQGV